MIDPFDKVIDNWFEQAETISRAQSMPTQETKRIFNVQTTSSDHSTNTALAECVDKGWTVQDVKFCIAPNGRARHLIIAYKDVPV